MPCNLTATRQVLDMTDQAGETYKLYYRLPSNPERVAFTASLYVKKGKKTVMKGNIFAEYVALGKKLITGFSENYFMDGDDFISSNPSMAHYRADWKDLLASTTGRPSDLYSIASVAMRPANVSAEDEEEVDPLAGADAEGDAEDGNEEATEETDAPLSSNCEASSNDAPPQTVENVSPETATG